MKTVDELSRIYADKETADFPSAECRYGMSNDEISDWFKDAFNAGVRLTQSWIDINDEKPEYYLPIIIYTEDGCVIAWGAWSETHGDVYTISGTDIILKETPKRWRPLNRK